MKKKYAGFFLNNDYANHATEVRYKNKLIQKKWDKKVGQKAILLTIIRSFT